ncbi:MAG: hypothetical protein ACE5GM_03140 [bacterium]
MPGLSLLPENGQAWELYLLSIELRGGAGLEKINPQAVDFLLNLYMDGEPPEEKQAVFEKILLCSRIERKINGAF